MLHKNTVYSLHKSTQNVSKLVQIFGLRFLSWVHPKVAVPSEHILTLNSLFNNIEIYLQFLSFLANLHHQSRQKNIIRQTGTKKFPPCANGFPVGTTEVTHESYSRAILTSAHLFRLTHCGLSGGIDLGQHWLR